MTAKKEQARFRAIIRRIMALNDKGYTPDTHPDYKPLVAELRALAAKLLSDPIDTPCPTWHVTGKRWDKTITVEVIAHTRDKAISRAEREDKLTNITACVQVEDTDTSQDTNH